MDEPISARYVWDADGLTDAWHAHQCHAIRPIVRYPIYLFMLLLIVATLGIPVWLIVDRRSIPEIQRSGAIAFVILAGIWIWYLTGVRNKRFLKWRARKAFRSRPTSSDLVEWSIGPDELHNRTANAASTILWPLFIKVVESPKGFLLYQSLQFFNWLPGHAFASERELRRFADLARTKVPKYVVVGECRFPSKPEPIGQDEL